MMGYITEGIGKWMNTRATNNFRDSNKQQYLDFIPNGLKRWVAHILLTTTINIASAALQDPNKHNDMDVPPGHFYNQELATFNIGGKNSIFVSTRPIDPCSWTNTYSQTSSLAFTLALLLELLTRLLLTKIFSLLSYKMLILSLLE